MKAGIIGLPNVGKSTLFNALTRTRKAESANYPFCTIKPNIGNIIVPDIRLDKLNAVIKPKKVTPAVIEIFDIAGIVKGASKGEGLGNQFLSNIRSVDALIHVVRCFDDKNISHNMGNVNPILDIEIISTELILADIQSIELQLKKLFKCSKSLDQEAKTNFDLLNKLFIHLNEGKSANTMNVDQEESNRLKNFNLLSYKPVIYALNVSEDDIVNNIKKNQYIDNVKQYLEKFHKSNFCIISAQIESDLSNLSISESKDFLKEMGIKDSGVSNLINLTYNVLGLVSYFTAGKEEVRAWTFKKGMKAPECAEIIHTDFKKGFIKAEIVCFDDLIKYKSYSLAREAGKYRLEGKEYVMKDGDIVIFRFNV